MIKLINLLVENSNYSEYSNDALKDMIINLSRYEGNEEIIAKVKDELKKRELAECGGCERQGTDYTHGHDHEASMADSELRDMISNASKLQNMIQPGDELPGWVSAYISLAADYMHSVAEYMAGQQAEMQATAPTPGFAIVAEKKK